MTGFEFVKPAAGSLATIIYNIVKAAGGNLIKVIGDQLALAGAASKYGEEYRQDYGLLKLLGMPQAVKLEDVYTGVRFLDELSIRRFESLEALEQAYRESQRRRFQTRQCISQDGMAVANENQYLMVLGGPGAGKSTFLRKVGLEALKGKAGSFQHECIPVFLELKRFDSDEIDLSKSIAKKFQNAGLPLAEEFTVKALEQGKLLVLLDGLDEVPKVHLNAVVEAIQDFVAQYDKNRFIASCRIAAHLSAWNRFTDIELADFDDEQIRLFIHNWFQLEQDQEAKTAEKCWGILNEPGNQSAKELAHTPLLLAFLCLVYNRTQGFPTKRATLYRKALDILLEEWAAEKRIQPGEIYQGLNTDLEKVLLAEIAYLGFIHDQLFFTEQELVEQIRTFLSDTIDKPKYLDGRAVLEAIAIQQGILVERAENIFSFSHLTLQEYLTAQHISQDHQLVKQLVTEYLPDQRWQEVFLLVAGLVGRTDELLKLMEAATQNYINTPRLNALLVWAEEATTGSEENYQPSVKRAFALSLALGLGLDITNNPHPLASAFELTLTLSNNSELRHELSRTQYFSVTINHIDVPSSDGPRKTSIFRTTFGLLDSFANTIEQAYAFEKARIFSSVNFKSLIAGLKVLILKAPDKSKSFEACIEFSQRICEFWLNALHVDKEWVALSKEEVAALTNYLYASELIVRCKEAAVRVSREKWEEIEARMLTVQGDRA